MSATRSSPHQRPRRPLRMPSSGQVASSIARLVQVRRSSCGLSRQPSGNGQRGLAILAALRWQHARGPSAGERASDLAGWPFGVAPRLLEVALDLRRFAASASRTRHHVWHCNLIACSNCSLGFIDLPRAWRGYAEVLPDPAVVRDLRRPTATSAPHRGSPCFAVRESQCQGQPLAATTMHAPIRQGAAHAAASDWRASA